MSDYLWDKTGEPDEDVEQLENLLGALKYQPRPLEIPANAMPTAVAARTRPSMLFSRSRLAIAASLLLMLLAGMWFVTRQDDRQKNRQLAEVEQSSPATGSGKPEKAVAANDETGNNAPVNNAGGNNTVAPESREAKAVVVRAATRERHRAPRRLIAGRQKLKPRVEENTPAPRELVATNGAPRWQVDEPLTPQQREATEQLMLALRVASAKFNYAQREMREIGRAGK